DNTTQDLLIVDPRTGDAREITRHAEDVSHIPAGWLADGRALAITDEGSDQLWLGALDVATGKLEPIDRPRWDVELAVSSANGQTQVWSVNEDGYSTLRWGHAGGPTRERRIDGACEDLVVAADGSRAAFTRLSPTEPWQVWTLDIATGEARVALTSSLGVPRSELVDPELIRIPGPDGDIPCFVYRPRGARGPTPAVLYPHGGPEGQSRPAFGPHLTHLAALIHRGVALVVPNIHGSTGYGRKWQAAIHKDWGGIDLREVRRAVADQTHRQRALSDAHPPGRERPARSEGRIGSGRGATSRARSPDRLRRLSRRRPRLHQARERGRRLRTDRGLSDEGARRLAERTAQKDAVRPVRSRRARRQHVERRAARVGDEARVHHQRSVIRIARAQVADRSTVRRWVTGRHLDETPIGEKQRDDAMHRRHGSVSDGDERGGDACAGEVPRPHCVAELEILHCHVT